MYLRNVKILFVILLSFAEVICYESQISFTSFNHCDLRNPNWNKESYEVPNLLRNTLSQQETMMLVQSLTFELAQQLEIMDDLVKDIYPHIFLKTLVEFCRQTASYDKCIWRGLALYEALDAEELEAISDLTQFSNTKLLSTSSTSSTSSTLVSFYNSSYFLFGIILPLVLLAISIVIFEQSFLFIKKKKRERDHELRTRKYHLIREKQLLLTHPIKNESNKRLTENKTLNIEKISSFYPLKDEDRGSINSKDQMNIKIKVTINEEHITRNASPVKTNTRKLSKQKKIKLSRTQDMSNLNKSLSLREDVNQNTILNSKNDLILDAKSKEKETLNLNNCKTKEKANWNNVEINKKNKIEETIVHNNITNVIKQSLTKDQETIKNEQEEYIKVDHISILDDKEMLKEDDITSSLSKDTKDCTVNMSKVVFSKDKTSPKCNRKNVSIKDKTKCSKIGIEENNDFRKSLSPSKETMLKHSLETNDRKKKIMRKSPRNESKTQSGINATTELDKNRNSSKVVVKSSVNSLQDNSKLHVQKKVDHPEKISSSPRITYKSALNLSKKTVQVDVISNSLLERKEKGNILNRKNSRLLSPWAHQSFQVAPLWNFKLYHSVQSTSCGIDSFKSKVDDVDCTLFWDICTMLET